MPFIEHAGRRLLYIHVPKTGGGSIERWMAGLAPLRLQSDGGPSALRCNPQHLRMSDIAALFGEGWFDRIFMTVRNPYERIASEYRQQAMVAGQGFWKSWPSLTQWLEAALARMQREPWCHDNHLRPQWQFAGSGVEVLRFESGLPAILARMAAALDLPPPAEVPHVHATGGPAIPEAARPPQPRFDLVDRLRVREAYRADFETFGYDPDDHGATLDRD